MLWVILLSSALALLRRAELVSVAMKLLMLETLAPASLVMLARSELILAMSELISPVWLEMKAETSLPILLAMDSPLE